MDQLQTTSAPAVLRSRIDEWTAACDRAADDFVAADEDTSEETDALIVGPKAMHALQQIDTATRETLLYAIEAHRDGRSDDVSAAFDWYEGFKSQWQSEHAEALGAHPMFGHLERHARTSFR